MNAMTPWTGLGTLKQEMDRLFDRFFEPRLEEFSAFVGWAPKLDVSETKDALVVNAEVAGVDLKDIEASKGTAQKQLYVIFTAAVRGLEAVLKTLDEHLKFQLALSSAAGSWSPRDRSGTTTRRTGRGKAW